MTTTSTSRLNMRTDSSTGMLECRKRSPPMCFGPFAYIPFILVFLKFNDGAYDMRQSVHKLMGVVSYLFIVINGVTGSGMLLMDIALFAFATFFFYRAMSDNFERVSPPALA